MTRSPRYLFSRIALSPVGRNVIGRTLIKGACAREGVGLTFRDSKIELRKRNRVIHISDQNLPFALEISRQFDSTFTTVHAHEQGEDSVLDFSEPHVHRYVDSGLEFEIVSMPEEEAARELYFRWYKPVAGELVFDVGANCGVTTYHFAEAVGPTGRVIAFEPDPANYRFLLRNIERHGLRNVIPVQRALSDANGYADFHSEGTLGSGLSSCATRPSLGEVEQVATMTLESACAEFGTPSYIKMDIEGAEIGVLAAAKEFLSRTSIEFVLDTNHMVKGKRTDAQVESILRDAEYRVETLSEGGFVTTWATRLAVIRKTTNR